VVDKQLTLSLWDPQESIAIQPLDRIERSLNFLSATTAAILDGLPVQRRPLAESTKGLHLRVTCLRRNGYCSCCQRVRVCDVERRLPGAEFDHWYGRHRNGPEETWLVCGACNRELETTQYKSGVRSSFEAYQHALRAFLQDGQRELFR
jgi:hypothetical protein